jgi:hypothetical protein
MLVFFSFIFEEFCFRGDVPLTAVMSTLKPHTRQKKYQPNFFEIFLTGLAL